MEFYYACYNCCMLTMKYKTKKDIEKQLQDFRILFAYHSNKIENDEINYHDTRDIFENGKVVNFTGNLRTLYEIENQKKCYEYLLDNIVDKNPITIDFIKTVHKILSSGTYDEDRYLKNERPGEFKKGDYVVGINDVGSDAKDVEKDLQELIEEINSTDSDDFLTIVSYFHCRFENIHPFADGNGRVGRTLLNYYLMIHNIKPLIIYDEDKKEYYNCLTIYDEKEDIKPLKEFLNNSQKKTWSKKKENYLKLNSFL